tara:strand:+ start:603 stop:788 length:186 start_codon:yes stop_codon:yes gene_type:complete
MDKYIIISAQDFLDWNSDKVKNHLYKAYDNQEKAGILRFNTIPALFSSKTVYTKDEIDAII